MSTKHRKSQARPNPIRAAREARGHAAAELAMLFGTTVTNVRSVELGHLRKLPESWRQGLTAAGYDFDALAVDYQAWREEAAAALVKAAAHG